MENVAEIRMWKQPIADMLIKWIECGKDGDRKLNGSTVENILQKCKLNERIK